MKRQRNRTVAQRIIETAQMEANTGCWLWDGGDNGKYGVITIGGRSRGAHRAGWEAHNGPIPAGGLVCHRCDTPLCVNPDHLFLGTQADNMRDMFAKRRDNHHRGERTPGSRLTAAHVTAIRARHAGGEGQATLARIFGVSSGAIQKVVERRSWKHVP